MNETYRSAVKNEELFDGLFKSFKDYPDFAKDASVIQIISHRIFKTELEINLLRFFAMKLSKSFTLYATENERIYVKPVWGDRILVQMVQTGIGQKLQNKWRGPYDIVKFNSDQTTTIKNGNKFEDVHNNRLRKYND